MRVNRANSLAGGLARRVKYLRNCDRTRWTRLASEPAIINFGARSVSGARDGGAAATARQDEGRGEDRQDSRRLRRRRDLQEQHLVGDVEVQVRSGAVHRGGGGGE